MGSLILVGTFVLLVLVVGLTVLERGNENAALKTQVTSFLADEEVEETEVASGGATCFLYWLRCHLGGSSDACRKYERWCTGSVLTE